MHKTMQRQYKSGQLIVNYSATASIPKTSIVVLQNQQQHPSQTPLNPLPCFYHDISTERALEQCLVEHRGFGG